MMTCLSPTSGSTSSGNRVIDRQPARAAAAATIRTTNRWRTEASIRRSIMPAGIPLPHVALRVEQESARHDDGFAGVQSVNDLHSTSEAPAGFHDARFERASAAVDEHR